MALVYNFYLIYGGCAQAKIRPSSHAIFFFLQKMREYSLISFVKRGMDTFNNFTTAM